MSETPPSVAAPHCAIAVIEDDPHVRAGVERALSNVSGWSVAWSAGSLAEARRHGITAVDLVLLDLGLPDGSGLDLIAEYRGAPPMLVLSAMGDEDTVLAALERGAAGYLLKDAAQQDVVDCIRSVLDGGAPITPSVATHILRRMRHAESAGDSTQARRDAIETLTARERDVLRTLTRGYSYEETARLLGISRHTVGHHIKQIYAKLAVSSRSEAVFEAIRAGWLEPDGR